jgi:eukaryotic-like serine/threonine-protein kinase
VETPSIPGAYPSRARCTTRRRPSRGALCGTVRAALGAHDVLERQVGRRGNRTVFRAGDLCHGCPVAVKMLHPELAAEIGAERFLAELHTTAALQHSHIPPLIDSGGVDGPLHYVMSCVEGETLRTRLGHERQLPVADAARVATEVASALEHAHSHGAAHRDIEPENTLLGEDGQALVADFGLTLALSYAGGRRITRTDASIGKPQYLGTEQATGERTIDVRTDMYALGAVTYEMPAGAPPFTKDGCESRGRHGQNRRQAPAHTSGKVPLVGALVGVTPEGGQQ